MAEDYKIIRLNALFKCYNVDCPQSYESNGMECMRCMIQHQWRTNEILQQLIAEKGRELAHQMNEGALEDDKENLAVRGLPDIQPSAVMNEEELEFLKRDDIFMLVGIREWQGPELAEVRELLDEGKKEGQLIQIGKPKTTK